MTLKVIGAGFGRTGTDSMREALNILGLGPCHHMFEVNSNDEQRRLWRALAGGAAPDWDRLLAGYSSCMDWPSAHYWRGLMAHFPEATVLLTYRSPESWWDSFEKTILAYFNQLTDPESLVATLVANQVFDGRPGDRAHAIARYEANVAAVRATVPKHRLLVHELGDGWQPLCDHLGLAVPETPFPSRNSTGQIKAAFAIN